MKRKERKERCLLLQRPVTNIERLGPFRTGCKITSPHIAPHKVNQFDNLREKVRGEQKLIRFVIANPAQCLAEFSRHFDALSYINDGIQARVCDDFADCVISRLSKLLLFEVEIV